MKKLTILKLGTSVRAERMKILNGIPSDRSKVWEFSVTCLSLGFSVNLQRMYFFQSLKHSLLSICYRKHVPEQYKPLDHWHFLPQDSKVSTCKEISILRPTQLSSLWNCNCRNTFKTLHYEIWVIFYKLKDWVRILQFSMVTAVWFVYIMYLIIICLKSRQGCHFVLACWRLVLMSVTLH